MTIEIAGVVKNTHNVDRVLAAAVDQKMPGPPDSSQAAPRPIAAEEQVICPDASRQVRARFRSGPFQIGGYVANRLLHQIPVALRRAPAKSLLAPYQCVADISPRSRG
jgi:hypothetical protein